jgi:hypothetical protein
MKMLILIALTVILFDCGKVVVPPLPGKTDGPGQITSVIPCDTTLWAHTYGAMKRFGVVEPKNLNPYDRHALYHRCVYDVRGQVVGKPGEDKDGDYKFTLKLDRSNFMPTGFYSDEELLGKTHQSPQANAGAEDTIIVEIVCGAAVTDPQNTEAADACRDYSYPGYKPRHGDVIDVTGELVTDTGPIKNTKYDSTKPLGLENMPFIVGHGWKEIHPVSLIKLVKSGAAQ